MWFRTDGIQNEIKSQRDVLIGAELHEADGNRFAKNHFRNTLAAFLQLTLIAL